MVGFAPAAQAAAPATITNGTLTAAIVGGTSDVIDMGGNACINTSPESGTVGTTGPVGNDGTAYLAHGFAPETDVNGQVKAVCPSAFSLTEQSSVGFTPMAPATSVVGEPFLLGRIVHHNNEIALVGDPNTDYHMSGGLQLTLGGITDTFDWTLVETANIGGPVDDVSTFSDVRSTQFVTLDNGLTYRLVIRGLNSANADNSCPAVPGAGMSNQFITTEAASTYGCIYASWEQVIDVTVVKVAESPVATTIPAFDYTVNWQGGGLAGWPAGFSLTPTALGAAGAVEYTNQMLLPLDGLTVSEVLPAYDPAVGGWRLTNLVCTDAAGAAVEGLTTNLATGTADLTNLVLAGTPAQADITCTYTNLYEPAASLAIEKWINGDDANIAPGVTVVPGTDMTVTFIVTNDGGRAVDNVTIVDDTIPAGSITPPATKTLVGGGTAPFTGTLEPGESATFTATWPAPADGVQHTNIAYATGDVPGSDPPINSPDDPGNAFGETPTAPAIMLNKVSNLIDTNGNGVADAGEVINYTFIVSNPGNEVLAPVTISDPMFNLTNAPCVDSLPIGGTATCSTTASYTVTEADIVEGAPIVNTAVATGIPPTGDPVTDDDTETVPVGDRNPAITLDKVSELDDTNGNGVADAGEVINYTFVVTNTGNLTLAPVTISDPMFSLTNAPCADSLAPGATATCTTSATYTVTEQDVLDGTDIVNTAVATGIPPVGDPVTDDDTETVPVGDPLVPAILLNKVSNLADTNGNGVADAGETITYTFQVTNTGNVPLAPVTISDPMFNLTAAACVDALAIGETATCSTTASYTVTETDIVERTSIVNTATATGTPPTGDPVTDDDTETVPVGELAPAILLDKYAILADTNGNSRADVGEVITYEFRVKNTGNVTLAPVTITDARFNLTNAACVDSLAVGEIATCSTKVTYTVTAQDVANGADIINTAVATGTPPTGDPVTDEDTVEVPTTTPQRPILPPQTGSQGAGAELMLLLGGTAAAALAVVRRWRR